MREEKHCRMCGKPTHRILLKEDQVKVYICSRKCEYEYFETLQGREKARQAVLLYLDKRVAMVKRVELCCWIIASVGFVFILLSIFFANVLSPDLTKWQLVGSLFFIGAMLLTGSMLFTSQLSKEKQKLIEKRRELALAY